MASTFSLFFSVATSSGTASTTTPTTTSGGSSLRTERRDFSWEDGLLTTTTLGTVPAGLSPIDVAELTGNSRVDLLTADQTVSYLYVNPGLGSTSTSTSSTVTSWGSPIQAAELAGFGPFSSDASYVGHGDIMGGTGEELITVSSTGVVQLHSYDSANQTFTQTDVKTINTSKWTMIGAGNVDQTSVKDELIFYAEQTGEIAVWTVSDTGKFELGYVIGTARDQNWKPIALADLDNDGDDEIVWAHATKRQFAYWDTDKAGRYVDGRIIGELRSGSDWKLVDVKDLSGDNQADMLFVNSETGSIGAWRLEDGRVVEAKTVATYSPSTTAVIDGRLPTFRNPIDFLG